MRDEVVGRKLRQLGFRSAQGRRQPQIHALCFCHGERPSLLLFVSYSLDLPKLTPLSHLRTNGVPPGNPAGTLTVGAVTDAALPFKVAPALTALFKLAGALTTTGGLPPPSPPLP